MNLPLRVLHLEDDRRDHVLVMAALGEGGLACAPAWARDGAEFERALDGPVDLILSDFSVPGFSGAQALRRAQERRPGLPFIYVSGTLGEEAAVEALLGGATDYVLKSNLKRLAPAVLRALREAEAAKARRAAEEALGAAEAQLRHAQKMEAVGRLAGGVAHDFNNLLTVILASAQGLEAELEGDPRREYAGEITAAAGRASELTRQLLAFGRRQVLNPRPLRLNDAVRAFERLLRRVIGEDIRVGLDLADFPDSVTLDPGQIEQVLLNLAVNARDAMPQGGTLRISTRARDVEGEAMAADGVVPAGRYVALTMADTGCGIAPEVMPRIFEPFFTTKPEGIGSGLGLATVFGIVTQSGGHLCVESAPGQGAVFTLLFPVSRQALSEEPAPAPAGPAAGTGTVLLVEDDAAVRKLLARVLRRAGYRVLEAGGFAEAAAEFEARRGEIDLVVTDLVLPGGTGRQLAGRVREAAPACRLLFMSGYSEEMTQGAAAPLPGPFVQKPLMPREFLEAVARAIS